MVGLNVLEDSVLKAKARPLRGQGCQNVSSSSTPVSEDPILVFRHATYHKTTATCSVNAEELIACVHCGMKENAEKQAQLDRALREKRSVEVELEKVYHEGILESGRESRDVTGLSERACMAERLRDEAQMKAESLANQLRRTEAL